MLYVARKVRGENKIAMICLYHDREVLSLRNHAVEDEDLWVKAGAADDFRLGKRRVHMLTLTTHLRMEQHDVLFPFGSQLNRTERGNKPLLNPIVWTVSVVVKH